MMQLPKGKINDAIEMEWSKLNKEGTVFPITHNLSPVNEFYLSKSTGNIKATIHLTHDDAVKLFHKMVGNEIVRIKFSDKATYTGYIDEFNESNSEFGKAFDITLRLSDKQ
jgi:hypothetical protein